MNPLGDPGPNSVAKLAHSWLAPTCFTVCLTRPSNSAVPAEHTTTRRDRAGRSSRLKLAAPAIDFDRRAVLYLVKVWVG